MAYIKQVFTGIECDECKKQFRETEDDAYYFQEDDANEAASDEEWDVCDNKHYCEKCKHNDH